MQPLTFGGDYLPMKAGRCYTRAILALNMSTPFKTARLPGDEDDRATDHLCFEGIQNAKLILDKQAVMHVF